MRKELKKINDVRATFTGTFERYGFKSGWYMPERTVLLKDIRNANGKIVTDHLWFNLTKGMESLGELLEGQTIQFDARVKPYIKGYAGRDAYEPQSIDYKLSHPTKIKLVEELSFS